MSCPYDHFPKEDNLKAWDPRICRRDPRPDPVPTAAASPRIRWVTRTGPSPTRRTFPVTGSVGWSGNRDNLPAVHLTSIIFDVLCALGLGLVGLRFGGRWLGAALAFAWAAFPFTQYVSMSNTNDAIVPVFLIFGLWLASSPLARGAAAALSGWTKFATLVVAPMWLTYPGPIQWRRPWPALVFATGFLAAVTAARFDGWSCSSAARWELRRSVAADQRLEPGGVERLHLHLTQFGHLSVEPSCGSALGVRPGSRLPIEELVCYRGRSFEERRPNRERRRGHRVVDQVAELLLHVRAFEDEDNL